MGIFLANFSMVLFAIDSFGQTEDRENGSSRYLRDLLTYLCDRAIAIATLKFMHQTRKDSVVSVLSCVSLL
ncbi:hypothetical protein AB3R30_04305 [Leptolyngbyaceae cyanobacterium UHCC 1019]